MGKKYKQKSRATVLFYVQIDKMRLILGSLLPALFCQLLDAGLDATAQESPIDLLIFC
jgi:hypothetical protein